MGAFSLSPDRVSGASGTRPAGRGAVTTTNNISTVCIEFPDEQPPRRLSARQRREALRGLARVHYLIGDRDGDVMACRCGHGNTAHRRFTGRCMTATGPDLQCPCVQLWPDPGSYWLLDG